MVEDNRTLYTVSREDWISAPQRTSGSSQTPAEGPRRNQAEFAGPRFEENIIMSDGKQIIKVPIRSLDEFRFVYNFNKNKHIGQGDGDSQVGDVLGVDPASAQKGGKGDSAGDQPGEDIVEAEISLAELETMLFEELELPFLKQKDQDQLETKEIRFNDIRKKGIMSNIDKKRTILENLKRNATAAHLAFTASPLTISAIRHGKKS